MDTVFPARLPRRRGARARYRTQPVTFAEIKEVDEELEAAEEAPPAPLEEAPATPALTRSCTRRERRAPAPRRRAPPAPAPPSADPPPGAPAS